MNEEQPTLPEFSQKRAKKLSTKREIWLIALFGIIVIALGGGLIGSMVGHANNRAGLGLNDGFVPWILVAFSFATMIPTLWWSIEYWRSIDEMAKRGHLDAFFWGGGMISWAVFLPLTVPMLAFAEFKLDFIEGLGASATRAFGLGVFTTIMITVLGYGLFWTVWWAKKR
jgi:hypothetical protein